MPKGVTTAAGENIRVECRASAIPMVRRRGREGAHGPYTPATHTLRGCARVVAQRPHLQSACATVGDAGVGGASWLRLRIVGTTICPTTAGGGGGGGGICACDVRDRPMKEGAGLLSLKK